LQTRLNGFVKAYKPDMLRNLTSIVGIGGHTAALLIIATQGFKNFDKAKQVYSYFGLAPTKTTSGTSINGFRKITKMGNH